MDMKENSIKWIIGASAQGRVTLDVWRSPFPDAEFRFIDDDFRLHGKSINGIPVDGGVKVLLENFSPVDRAIVAIGNNSVRLLLGTQLEAKGIIMGNAIHISAVVMQSAQVSEGCMIFAQAVVNTGAKIGRHVIINTSAVVEHDSLIEEGVLIGSSVSMGGRVVVEKGAFIGTGTILAPRVRVGKGSVIGAGSVVVKDLPPGVLAYGVPARVVKKLDQNFNWSRLL